jgi:23S rRNA (adenine2503-C2)-methyltransferase
VSTQVGCAVGCGFCASGARGLGRNLTQEELSGQLEAVLARGHEIRRVTLSGVGEPLHNLGNALGFMQSCRALGVAPSLTTSGGPIARLEQMLRHPHNGLTLSVHAGTEAMRASLLPRAPSLAAIFECLRSVLPSLTQRRRRKTALSYLLLAGTNDAPEEIDAFLERAVPLRLTVHLFAFNPVSTNQHRALPEQRYRAIYARMVEAGLRVRMSSQARIEQNGGCGTLLALRVPRAESAAALSTSQLSRAL